MSDQTEQLLPCPMCGCAAKIHEMEDYVMACCECGVNYEGPNASDCAFAWNSRATPAPQAAPSDVQMPYTAMELLKLWREAAASATNHFPPLFQFAKAIWQRAAPAVAITERPTDDDLWDATLRDRDTYHEWADKLADAISKYFGAYIGEHSNTNCPWSEALEAIENAPSAVAITQAATSEPVAADCHKCGMPMLKNPHPDAGKPEVYLEVGCPTECLPCTVKSRHGWYRRAMEAQTKAGELEKQIAHLAGTTPNTEAPSDERMKVQALIDGAQEAMTYGLDNPNFNTGRTPRGLITDAIAALSAQQAGVQEAPSEDAKDERVHELDAAMSLLRVALTVDAGKVSPAALRKQVMESVAIAAGADGEGEEYIYADVYGHLRELIEPYVLSDERPEGYPFTASVTDTMSMLIEHYQRTAALAAATQTEKK